MKVVKVHPSSLGQLQLDLAKQGFKMEERPNQAFFARLGKTSVSAYNTGKVVATGEDAALVWAIERYAEEEAVESALESISGPRIGVDEAGKGDYFGPLVTCAVFVDSNDTADRLKKMGVKDSKKLSNTTVSNLAVDLRSTLPRKAYKVVSLLPAKYNVLSFEMRNVNTILGWSHATAIEDVLKNNRDCPLAISDQFGDRRFIESKLKELGKEIRLVQEPRAEREVSVAAASILARDEFLQNLEKMTQEYGIQFPRGATNVIPTGKEVYGRLGTGGLLATAKVHFSTTKSVLGDANELTREVQALQRQNARPDGSKASALHLEVYSLLYSFERELQDLIEEALQRLHGENWWAKGVKPGLRKAAEKLFETEAKRGRNARLIECLYLVDLGMIIRDIPNWEGVFKGIFGEQTSFNARFTILAEIRNPTAHPRDLRIEDKLAAIAHVSDLRHRMIAWRASTSKKADS